MLKALPGTGLLLLAITATAAETAATAAHARPTLRAHPLESAPVLDGRVVGDPAWQGAAPATGFSQVRPDEGRPATQRTEVFVGVTDEALYIGVVCYDDNPGGIIVAGSQRDASLTETDSFQVILDTFRDRQNGLVFGTNPAGVEYDGQVTREGTAQFGSGGGGFNLDWDTTWQVRTQVSDIGWSAEMEIPFKSLRYGREAVQTWGINFQRNIRRNNEAAFWAPLPRQHNLYRVSQAGDLEGVRVPQQRNLKVTPYLLGTAARGGDLPAGTHDDQEFGVDLKYSLTPGLTLDLTYNTDFAQVEADELQVNLDRFSLFFPEKRPFFLENAGQFAVGTPGAVELFFSRRIGIGQDGAQIPIDGGLRLSGKVGASTNVGFLQMRSAQVSGVTPRNDYTVARVSRELPNRSSFGAIAVQRRGASGNDYNRTFGIDGRWGLGDNTLLSGYAAVTDTPGLSGDEHAFNLKAEYNSETWTNNVGYTEVGANFNPEVGFLSRRGYRRGDFLVLRRFRPDDLWGLQELRPHASWRGFWDFDGYYETGYLHVDNHWEWKSGHEIHTGVNFTHEGVKQPFEIVRGVTVPAGEYDHEEAQLVFFTNQGAPLSFFLEARIGGFFGGDRVRLSPSVEYRIGEAFNVELGWDRNDISLPVPNGDFEVNVGRLRATYSFTPKMSVSALLQYDDRNDLLATNLRFAWLQSASAGLYLVYNEIDEDRAGLATEPRREFILKYSRIFDL